MTKATHGINARLFGVIMVLLLFLVQDGGTTKAVRLVGNSTIAGRVEIFHQGSWNPICYDGWDTHDAFVACRQLGFSEAASIKSDTTISPLVWLSGVRCQGTESTLGACPHGGWSGRNCGYGYAAITCTGKIQCIDL